jgi:hypothetical protein
MFQKQEDGDEQEDEEEEEEEEEEHVLGKKTLNVLHTIASRLKLSGNEVSI